MLSQPTFAFRVCFNSLYIAQSNVQAAVCINNNDAGRLRHHAQHTEGFQLPCAKYVFFAINKSPIFLIHKGISIIKMGVLSTKKRSFVLLLPSACHDCNATVLQPTCTFCSGAGCIAASEEEQRNYCEHELHDESDK